jgi:S-adenosyl-L-methionine hydrolase (adenosine-forming)
MSGTERNAMAIYLFTDFGSADLYVGQVKSVLERHAGGVPVIDLLHEVPNFNVRAGAHLLAALAQRLPGGSVTMAVVDPGVGSSRGAVALQADGNWYVGPDNGLLAVVAARASASACWHITWQPQSLSASFHGRDLFAPVAAAIAAGTFPGTMAEPITALQCPLGGEDLAEIIYIDHYGNALTGLRAGDLHRGARVLVAGRTLEFARVFSDAVAGAPFWYEDSLGLVEIAANGCAAASALGLRVGDLVEMVCDRAD